MRLKRSTLHRVNADSGGQPSADGIHELAASRWNSPAIARRLVVSYTTFSPLPPNSQFSKRGAVVLFFHIQPSPTASTFRSGAPFAARTFLSCLLGTSDRPWHCFPRVQRYKKSPNRQAIRTCFSFFNGQLVIVNCLFHISLHCTQDAACEPRRQPATSPGCA